MADKIPGDHTMVFADTGLAYNVPNYPKDGLGTVTITADESFVRDATESVVHAITAGLQGGNYFLELYHGDGTRAYRMVQQAPAQAIWTPDLGPNGIRLRGNWYAQATTNTDAKATLVFSVTS